MCNFSIYHEYLTSYEALSRCAEIGMNSPPATGMSAVVCLASYLSLEISINSRKIFAAER